MRKVLLFVFSLFLLLSCSKIQKGSIYTVSAVSFPAKSLCHQNYVGRLEDFVEDNDDFKFRVVEGLAGENSISFESVNFPDYYLRHVNFVLFLAPREDSEVFKNDSSFIVKEGLSNSNLVSFEAVNFPGYYLRHSSFAFFINENDNSNIFKEDATFILSKK